MLPELARAPFTPKFGQLIRGDADEAKSEIRRLFSSKIGRSVYAQVGSLPRRLKVVSVLVYGTETQALLDSGAIPNLMSDRLAVLLFLSPEATTKKITVADETAAKVHGTVGKVPVSFAGLKNQLDFLVVEGNSFDVIIGCLALEELQGCLDLGQQQVTITVNGKIFQLGFEYDNSLFRALESGTDSEDFTSEESDDSVEFDDEGCFVTVLDEPPYEPELSPDSEEESDEDMPGLLELDEGYDSWYDSGWGNDSTLLPTRYTLSRGTPRSKKTVWL